MIDYWFNKKNNVDINTSINKYILWTNWCTYISFLGCVDYSDDNVVASGVVVVDDDDDDDVDFVIDS